MNDNAKWETNGYIIDQYKNYLQKISQGTALRSGDEIPFFSFSSMSPVLADFVAMIKELNPTYLYEDVKALLQETSYEITSIGANWYEVNPCKHVVDIGKAIETILNRKKPFFILG